jgi:amino acid transporter
MPSESLVAVLVLGLAGVVVVATLYLIMRLLDWSKDRALPGEHNRIFNIALASLVAVIAMLLIVDTEMALVLPSLKSSLVNLIEEIDLVATGLILLLIVFSFMMLKRGRGDRRMAKAS